MGHGRFSSSDWTSYTTTKGYNKKSTTEIYSSRAMAIPQTLLAPALRKTLAHSDIVEPVV